MNLDILIDTAHADALEKIKIEEDLLFFQRDREPGHRGCSMDLVKKLEEERTRLRKLEEKRS